MEDSTLEQVDMSWRKLHIAHVGVVSWHDLQPMESGSMLKDYSMWRSYTGAGHQTWEGRSGKEDLLWTDCSLPFPIPLHCPVAQRPRSWDWGCEVELGRKMGEGKYFSFHFVPHPFTLIYHQIESISLKSSLLCLMVVGKGSPCLLTHELFHLISSPSHSREDRTRSWVGNWCWFR